MTLEYNDRFPFLFFLRLKKKTVRERIKINSDLIIRSSLLLQFRVERLWGRDHEQASGYGQGRGLRSARGKSGNSLSRW